MRLALITQDFLPQVGGIQTYALELSKRFNRECDFFCLVSPWLRGARETDARLPFRVKRIRVIHTLLGWAAIMVLPVYLRRNRVDTIFHTQWQTLPVSVFLKKTGLIRKIFVAAHARELLYEPAKENSLPAKLFDRYKRWLLSYVDHFFPVSEYTAGLLRAEGVEEGRMDVVINGTDPQKFHPVEVDSLKSQMGLEGRKVLLTITRLVSRKGIDTVLQVLPGLKEKHPDIFYLIIGEGGYRDTLERMVVHLELQEYVKFVGRIPYEQLNRYYNVCDVFVMPSKSTPPDVEGFGIVFLEANACAKPVIGSKSGGIPSAILHQETGLLVEEQDPGELAGAIVRLLENPDFARKLGENGRKRVQEEANWNASASEILQIMLKQ